MRRLLHILSVVLIVTLISCGSDSNSTGPDSDPNSEPEPTTGTVEITTNTSGNDQDDDGYKVTIGNNEKDISINETVSFDNLDEGNYDAELSNIAGNCSVNGDNPRSISVTADETTSATFEIQCQEIQPVAEQEAVDAVKQVIQNKGWTVPSKSVNKAQTPAIENSDPTIFDYIATDVNDSGTRQVYMLIGPDGHLIPTSEWQENNQYKCQNEELRYMKAAQKRFNLKMFSLADGYDVFAQYIDMATSEIEAQREGESSSLVDAITTAWDKMEKPVKNPADPCGDKIDSISLQFNSSTTHDQYHKDAGFTDTYIEEVKATVELTYNTEDSMYVGSGGLSWEKFDRSFADCDLPEDATAKVHKFVYDDPTANDPKIELQLQFFDWNKPACSSPDIGDFEGIPDFSVSWWALHEGQILKEIELDGNVITDESIYALSDLNPVLINDQIVAFKKYDQGTTKEDDDQEDTFYEETTIEIRRNSDSDSQ